MPVVSQVIWLLMQALWPKNNARLEFEELRTVDTVDEMGEAVPCRSFG